MTNPEVALRPCAPADVPFLLAVYASTRADELALAPWSEADKAAFVRMQFDAQDRDYRGRFPSCDRSVVLVDGVPAGRLYVDTGLTATTVVDVSLLPEFRGLGAGTRLLERVLADAAAGRRAVRLHVDDGNPARRLYVRLGFRPVGRTGPYESMECQPWQTSRP